jgi:nucleoside-diphosphate-sugar epimerase
MTSISNVLITGGTGFVGQWMKHTKPANVSVTYLGREAYAEFIKQEFYPQYDAFVHLAPVAPYPIVACAKWNRARMLYCSSGIVYHPEHHTEYRRHKLAWEQYCIDSEIDLVITRLFTFSGQGLDDGKAITQFYKCALAGKPLQVYGDGSTVRSYMHGAELGETMWKILERGERGKAYDVGSLIPVTMLDLANLIILITKSKSTIEFVDKPNPVLVYLPHKEFMFND